jgi:hypothetical protein
MFLWKNYLGEQNIPNIVFYTTLKNILKEKYTYEEESDSYLNITSTQLPMVSKFIKLWSSVTVEYDSELEVDEMLILFNNGKHTMNMNMNEALFVDLIHHFYPDVIIVDNKFIQQVKCSLWDKRSDVINSIESFKLKCSEQEDEHTKSLNDAYEYYLTLKNTINASKRYFERVALELINIHIDEDGLIKSTWWKGEK